MANNLTGKLKPSAFTGGTAQGLVAVNLGTDYGAVGDGVTDDTAAFMNMQAELLAIQAASSIPVSFLITAMPNKTHVVQNNRWLWGLRNVVVDFCGSSYQNTKNTPGITENMYPLLTNRGAFQTSGIAVFPQSGLVPGYLINTAQPGSNIITTTTASDSTNFIVGRWILIYSYDQEFGGQPPNAAYSEYVKVTAVNTSTGVITLDRSTIHYHSATYPDSQEPEAPCGRARAAVIDRTDIPFCEYLELRNMTVLANPNILGNPSAYGSQYLLANNIFRFVMRNVNCPSLIPSEMDSFLIEDSSLSNLEIDKCTNRGTIINSTILTTSDGTSLRLLDLINCHIKGPMFWNPKVLNVFGGILSGATDEVYSSGSFQACIGSNLFNAPCSVTVTGASIHAKNHQGDTIWAGQNVRPVTVDGTTITLTNNYTLSGPVTSTPLQNFVAAAQPGSIVLATASPYDGVKHWGYVESVYGGISAITMDIAFDSTIPAGAIITAYPFQSISLNGCKYDNWTYGVNGQPSTYSPFKFVPKTSYEDRIINGVKENVQRHRINTFYGSNYLFDLYGTLQSITVNVIRAYTGTDPNPTVNITNVETGSPSLSEVISLSTVGMRTITNTTTSGSQTGDTLTNLASQYLQQIKFVHGNSTFPGLSSQLSGISPLQAIYEVVITTSPDFRTMVQ